MPAPQGQTFFVLPARADDQGTLEFQRYGALVAQALQAQGYQPANSVQSASMVVKVDYGVDDGTRQVSRDPFGRSMYADPFYRGYYDPFYRGYYGRPYYSRYGYYGSRSPFYYGWQDPFWYSPFGDRLDDYTVYKSFLALDIRRAADNVAIVRRQGAGAFDQRQSGRPRPEPGRSLVHRIPGTFGRSRENHGSAGRKALVRSPEWDQETKNPPGQSSGRVFHWSSPATVCTTPGEVGARGANGVYPSNCRVSRRMSASSSASAARNFSIWRTA